MTTFRLTSSSNPRSAQAIPPGRSPRRHAAPAKPSLAETQESEVHAGGWEFRYCLAASEQMVSGFAEIHCNGEPYFELPIFEPQANALASIDLLREQCLAWIEARAAVPARPSADEA
jgi:hypothetical protein